MEKKNINELNEQELEIVTGADKESEEDSRPDFAVGTDVRFRYSHTNDWTEVFYFFIGTIRALEKTADGRTYTICCTDPEFAALHGSDTVQIAHEAVYSEA